MRSGNTKQERSAKLHTPETIGKRRHFKVKRMDRSSEMKGEDNGVIEIAFGQNYDRKALETLQDLDK